MNFNGCGAKCADVRGALSENFGTRAFVQRGGSNPYTTAFEAQIARNLRHEFAH
jgi:hypothetical protein